MPSSRDERITVLHAKFFLTVLATTTSFLATLILAEDLPAAQEPVYLDRAESAFPEIFPGSTTPASELVVFDARRLSPATQAFVASLQGIVNRDQPELYVILSRNRIVPLDQESGRRESIDQVWLDWLLEHDYVKSVQRVPSLEDLLQRYPLRDVVVVDPELSAGLNLATMLAAVKGIPLAFPEDVDRLDLNPVEDTRGRWNSQREAYQWAFENLWPEMEHRSIAVLSPRIHGHLRDYLVGKKIFTFWISNKDYGDSQERARELSFFKQCLRKMPVNIPVLGYPNGGGPDTGIGEGLGVKLFSDHGKFLVPTDWHTNLSVWTGWKPQREQWKQKRPRPLKYDPEKRYLTILVSDGDNMNLWLDFLPTHRYWRSPIRGELPIAWTMGPGMLQLHAPLLQYYFDSMTDMDSFGCALSGLGYMYPQHYGEVYGDQQHEIYRRYLKLTNQFTRCLDMTWFWGTIIGQHGDQKFSELTEQLEGLECILEGYGRQWWTDVPYQVNNVPVFHFMNNAVDVEPTRREVQRFLQRNDPQFGVIFIQNWPFDMQQVQKLCQSLGDDIQWVRPEELADLYRQSLQQQADQ